MKDSSSQPEHGETLVTVVLSAESNGFLIEAAKVSGRSKKIEAQIRLADHLKRFEHYLTPDVLQQRVEDKRHISEYCPKNK